MEWERKNWIEEYEAGERIAEIARKWQVSRQSVHKWIVRFEDFGEEGLRELSRAPREHPQAISELWQERICGVRAEHARWGAPKLHRVLEERYGVAGVPSESSIGRVLKQRGMTMPRGYRARAHGTGKLHSAVEPNQVWAIDFKGWCRTGDGQRCEPLTLTDLASRYLLYCQALPSQRIEVVRPVLERLFRTYGLPERMRSDNGSPFASKGECGLTGLSVWWIELGIGCERIEPGCPRQNGSHERMHRTLKEATMQPPAGSLRAQQRRLDQFRQEFNEQRPHQALGQQRPVEVYRNSEREFPPRIQPPQYGSGWQVRVVAEGGQVRHHGWRWFLSHALTGKQVGLEAVEEGLWNVWFYRHWLGVWDQRAARLWRPRQWEKRQLQNGPSFQPLIVDTADRVPGPGSR